MSTQIISEFQPAQPEANLTQTQGQTEKDQENEADNCNTHGDSTEHGPETDKTEKVESEVKLDSNQNMPLEIDLVQVVNKLNISEDQGDVVVTQESASLRNLIVYNSDSSSSDDEDWQLRAVHSESSSSSSDSDSDVYEDMEAETNKGAIKKQDKREEYIKAPGELTLDDLPPVPDLSTLSINVKDEELTHMGHIHGIIDRIVTVESLPNIPAYDCDTTLFYGEEKKPLGVVFDVFGQISCPIYAIRFNSPKDIQDKKIEKGMKVFSAPSSELTQYVFVRELLKLKGSDASWVDDLEAPVEASEFSDDEQEYFSKTGNKPFQRHQKRPHSSLERHRRFERTMNQCNTLNTKVQRLLDARNPVIPQPPAPVAMPAFNPAVPPPAFPEIRPFYNYHTPDPTLGGWGQHMYPTLQNMPPEASYPSSSYCNYWPGPSNHQP